MEENKTIMAPLEFKEFENLQGYYLKLEYYEKYINLVAYNIESLDGIRYEIKLYLLELYEYNDIFKIFRNVKIFYEAFQKILQNKNFSFIKTDDHLKLSIILKDLLNQNVSFDFNFNITRIETSNEYLNILTNEIKKLKNICKLIDSLVEENNIIKLELSNLMKKVINISAIKENNKQLNKQLTLDEFNAELNLRISDFSIKKLNLREKNYGNIILDYLTKITFEHLIKIDLGFNNISDLSQLQNINFSKLEFLSLDNNKISDINVLEKVKFVNLKNLYLIGNNISDINILEKVNFPNLETLKLSNNKIININVFQKVNFPKLEELDLSNNKIKVIYSLGNTNFKELKTLLLNDNEIESLNGFVQIKAERLKELDLNKNKLKDISPLENLNLPLLEKISLSNNNIIDLSVFQKIKLPNLKRIYLFNNNIQEISGLEKANFPHLDMIYLSGNYIDKKRNDDTIKLMKRYLKL